VAVREWVPTLRVDDVNVATPLELRLPVASVTAPSLNVTLPPGVPVIADLTVAVSEID
jgi:hypothetical protein